MILEQLLVQQAQGIDPCFELLLGGHIPTVAMARLVVPTTVRGLSSGASGRGACLTPDGI